MTKREWRELGIFIVVVLGLYLLFDYADYNTTMRNAEMASGVPAEVWKILLPYKPFYRLWPFEPPF